MQGAREYAELFGTGQHGRMYFLSGEHARGRTFHIYVLPTDEPVSVSIHMVENAVEVYGIRGGQPGWTEYYGWLHEGKWQQDFAELLQSRIEAMAAEKALLDQEFAAREEEKKQHTKALLDRYDDGEASR